MKSLGSRSVYIIGCTKNPVKIGIAESVSRRLMEMQVSCPDELLVFHEVRVPYYLAEPLEKAAHKALWEHHRRGEWFNVEADYALEVVNGLKQKHLPAYQREIQERGDLLERLAAVYPIHASAREAVCDYRDAVDANDDAVTGHANGYVLQEAGQVAYAAFSLVVAQRKPLSALKGSDRLRAEAALVKALNALGEFRDKQRDAKFRQDMLKNIRWTASAA